MHNNYNTHFRNLEPDKPQTGFVITDT